MSAMQPSGGYSQYRRAGRRAASRVRLRIPATIILLSGKYACQLDDLSQTGARLTIDPPPPPHASGVLVINGLEAFGEVVWSSMGRAGMAFDEPMPLEQVIAVRHYADSFAEHEQNARERMVREFVMGRPRST